MIPSLLPSCPRSFSTLLRCTAAVALMAGIAPAQEKVAKPRPDAANVQYGPHARNVFDLWLPKGSDPHPLVLYFHGGGFYQGDKGSLDGRRLRQYLDEGWAVAAINYRFTSTAPAPAAYLDGARALQTIRHRAKQWNINPTLVASTGGSAGAGISLWLAFHDDLAEPKSGDPITRESTRLTCAAVSDAQCSYDPRFAEKIGIPRPNFERHRFFLPFYGITKEEIDTPKAYALYEQMAPITYLTKDDPPVLLSYSRPNDEVTVTSELGLVVHHPKLGLALKQRMDALGIECVVQYKEQPDPNRTSPVEFIKRQFAKAQKK